MSAPTTESIWRALHADLRRFLLGRVRDEHLVDDLLQETFLRIHRSTGSLKHTDRVRAWVFQIARNVVADHRRGAGARADSLDVEVAEERAGGEDPCGKPEAGGPHPWVEELLDQLPDQYRIPLRWHEVDGLTQAQVAARLGLSATGARSRVQRGRERLRQALEACCHFEFDRRGGLIDAVPRSDRRVCRHC